MIKISNYEKKGDYIVEFDVSGIDVSAMNAFRRTIVSTIPTMAMENITFLYNSSILNDENLAHRLGLVPLTTDLKTYTMQQDCSCKGEGCGKCVYKLTLDITGPGIVYSGDLKSLDDRVKPVYDKIPLIKLSKDQKIKLEADAILGQGRMHSKWQSGLASFEIKDKNNYHVMVESYGSLPVEELITTAFDVIEGKIKQIKEELA
jgi:DNA-directed RNA polymerase subunit D